MKIRDFGMIGPSCFYDGLKRFSKSAVLIIIIIVVIITTITIFGTITITIITIIG